MSLEIDIKNELKCLQQDITYITQIVKWAENNWRKDTVTVKTLLEAVLSFIKEGLETAYKTSISIRSYEEAYVKTIICMEWYYLTFSKYEEGTEKALEVYEICRRLNYPKEIMRICNILLVAYMKQGLFETAIEYGLQGIEIAKKNGDEKSESTLVLNIMQFYIELKEYDRALQVAKYVEEKGYSRDPKRELFIESALAEIKFHTNNSDEAIRHCEKAYNCALEQGDNNAIAEILYIRGQIQAGYNKVEEAQADFEKFSQISKENNYKELIVRGLISLGKERLSGGHIGGVEEKLKEAVALADEINAIHLKAQAYSVLEELYDKTYNWKAAYAAVKAKEKCTKDERTNKSDTMWLTKLEEKSIKRELQSYKRLYQQIQKISQVGQIFTANLEIDEMIDMIYEQVNELVPADIVGLGMRKKNGDFLYKVYGREGEVLEVNKSLYDRALSIGVMTLDMDEDIIISQGNFEEYFTILGEQESLNETYFQSAMFTKLKIEETPLGIIGIGNYKKNAYTQNDLRSLQILASYLAVALRNADLFNEVEYLAMYDALTGIYNRGTVLKLGEEQFKKNNLLGKDTSIIMLDVDYFKQVNDQYGHTIGDKILTEIGQILKESVRSLDFLGRYGGEEFIIILNDASLESSRKIAERINKKVKDHKFMDGKKEELAISVSCGVYLCDEEEEFEIGIKKADDALYEAKALGRNRIVVYEENTKQER